MSKFKDALPNALKDRGVDQRAVEGATEPKSRRTGKTGKYMRLTITLRPDQFRRLNDIQREIVDEVRQRDETAEVEFGKMDLARWLIDVALIEYDEGARPTFGKRLTAARE